MMAGVVKLRHDPPDAFPGVFVEQCMAVGLEGFNPQDLSLVIHGKAPHLKQHSELSHRVTWPWT